MYCSFARFLLDDTREIFVSIKMLMNWLGCGRTDGQRLHQPATRIKGLPYVGTLSNGADVYTDLQPDPNREATPDCIYFVGGQYYGVNDCNVKNAKIELRYPKGGDVSIAGGTIENSRINVR